MIFTLLATIGGAIASGAAAIGGAVAGLGASALAAASAIGATTLIGGITVAAAAKAAGLIFVGVLISGSSADEAETRGYKRGQANASKSYEAKLRKQAEEFFNQLAQAKKDMEAYRSRAETSEKLLLDALELTRDFEACIVELQKKGEQIDGETAGYYQQLQEVSKEARSHIMIAA